MKHKIEYPKSFAKKAKKLINAHPALKNKLTETLFKLSNDIFEPSLQTHALKGRLEGKYACSLTHDLRIIFKVTSDTIHLINIGTHEEDY